LLADAVRQLDAVGAGSGTFAKAQGVRQFNALLSVAKELYPERLDGQSLEAFDRVEAVEPAVYRDAVTRLRGALELRPSASVAALLDQIQMPSDAGPGVASDLGELREAATLGLAKTTLLLAGLVTEALLLSRHPDSSERGPGLGALVNQARTQKLFGRDTLRHLETLVDYRDLIHPRAETRNRTKPNEARVQSALSAVRLLCDELTDLTLRYT